MRIKLQWDLHAPVEFMKQFPAPQERTKEEWAIVNAYFRAYRSLWNKEAQRSRENAFVRHLEECFVSEIGEADFDSEW